MKVVIVGGVAGGASAAARIRRLDEHSQIIMIERSGYVSYANCGLPYYVGGMLKACPEVHSDCTELYLHWHMDLFFRKEYRQPDRQVQTAIAIWLRV